MSTDDKIKALLDDNRVLLFMKGTPDFPQCGFSMRAASIVRSLGVSVPCLANPGR